MLLRKDFLEFRPEILPLRGEKIGWLLTGITGILWLILILLGRTGFWFVPLLFFFFFFSSLIIHINNWMDKNTILGLNEDGIRYRDGLREINIHWKDIEKVETFPSKWGVKVYVSGNGRRFTFRTLGVVELQGQSKGKIGFAEGDMILITILERAGLTNKIHTTNSDLYTR